jgi:hypothetical protein
VGPGDIGPSDQWQCVKGRGENEAMVASGADRRDRQHSAAGADLNRFKQIQICPNLDRSKRCLSVLQKLEMEYGWKELEMRNNPSYRNLSRFESKFEFKLKEISMS